jgi:hypothetical protein
VSIDGREQLLLPMEPRPAQGGCERRKIWVKNMACGACAHRRRGGPTLPSTPCWPLHPDSSRSVDDGAANPLPPSQARPR